MVKSDQRLLEVRVVANIMGFDNQKICCQTNIFLDKVNNFVLVAEFQTHRAAMKARTYFSDHEGTFLLLYTF